jgi:hypothetical protein
VLSVDNNIHTNLGASAYPTSNDRFYFVSFGYDDSNNYNNHAIHLKTLLEQAGINYDSSSMTAAESALDQDVCFTQPYFGESSYRSYIEVAQDLLGSTFGYLNMNDEFELAYNLFDTTAAGDEITNDIIDKDSLSGKVNYQDIYNQIYSVNDHVSSDPYASTVDDKSYFVSQAKSQYLHGGERVYEHRNLLRNYFTKVDKLHEYKRNRRVTYKFKTANKNIDSQIGDNLTLTNSDVANSAGTDNLRITGLNKGTDRTEVIANDLGDLT